ncbi:S46 family peptidase [Acetobacteraceae bacterium]|nr:S46 family peptidase [Acetobacteraceae bacterium]
MSILSRSPKRRFFASLLGASFLSTGIFGAFSTAHAEEGMWTFDHLPISQIKAKYGFEPDQAWIEHLTKSSARLSMGCSASFVSGDGLVMTNHHCAVPCLSDISDKKHDYYTNGFSAKSNAEERQCPGLEVDRLDKITDISDKVSQITAGKEGDAYNKALEAYKAQVTKECVGEDKAKWRCDVVTLFHGGKTALYRYRRYNDIRIVTAPEQAIANFGGDPDNFTYPRYDLDYSFMRAYEDGKPVHTEFLKFDVNGPKEGDLVFTSGNPGRTQREYTASQLILERDLNNPRLLNYLNLKEGMLWQYGNESAEHRVQSQDTLFFMLNSLKAISGTRNALTDSQFIQSREKQDASLEKWMKASPERVKAYGKPFDEIEKIISVQKKIGDEAFIWAVTTRSGALHEALALVESADQRQKPDAERDAGFHDSELPALEANLLAEKPFYSDFETANLALDLTYGRQILGPNADLPVLLLGKENPDKLAARLIKGTKLGDAKNRKALYEGGQKAIDDSKDPLIAYAKRIYPAYHNFKTNYRNQVEIPLRKVGEVVGKARFEQAKSLKQDGNLYPDATFSPRLSYGQVKGWTNAHGKEIAPFTNIENLYRHATGEEPFKLPDSWVKAESKLTASVPVNLVSTNDIIGGNSGSPLIDKKGDAVGLIFDGNIEGLVGDYYYDGKVNRAVSVDTAAIAEALNKVYGEARLVKELENGKQ